MSLPLRTRRPDWKSLWLWWFFYLTLRIPSPMGWWRSGPAAFWTHINFHTILEKNIGILNTCIDSYKGRCHSIDVILFLPQTLTKNYPLLVLGNLCGYFQACMHAMGCWLNDIAYHGIYYRQCVKHCSYRYTGIYLLQMYYKWKVQHSLIRPRSELLTIFDGSGRWLLPDICSSSVRRWLLCQVDIHHIVMNRTSGSSVVMSMERRHHGSVHGTKNNAVTISLLWSVSFAGTALYLSFNDTVAFFPQ